MALSKLGKKYRRIGVPVTGGTNDGIYQDGGFLIADLGELSAERCKILTTNTGAANATALSAACARADVYEIFFNNPKGGAYPLAGASPIDCNGKTLVFRHANEFSGTFTLTNFKLRVNSWEKIFPLTATLTNMKIDGSVVPAGIFGARWDNTGDQKPALQKVMDTIFANSYLPSIMKMMDGGIYRIGSSLMYMSFNAAAQAWQQCTVSIVGGTQRSNMARGLNCIIVADFKDHPLIATQLAYGGGLFGVSLMGQWTPPTLTDQEFYNIDWNDYKDPTVRDDRNSPGSIGVGIDVFRNGSLPPDNGFGAGYPGWSTYYTQAINNSTTSGSTGLVFDDMTLFNLNAGFVISPNGQSQNAEILTFKNLHFIDVKTGFSCGHDQERANLYENCQFWGKTHTIITNRRYGQNVAGHNIMRRFNIAGLVQQIFDCNNGGYSPWSIRELYSEQLGSLGYFHGDMVTTIDESYLNFNVDVSVKNNGDLFNVHMRGGAMQKPQYNPYNPMQFAGTRILFESLYFSTEPITMERSGAGSCEIKFKNCVMGGGGTLGATGDISEFQASNMRHSVYGDFALSDYAVFEYRQLLKNTLYQGAGRVFMTTAALTISSAREATINVGSFPVANLTVNQPLIIMVDSNPILLGRIKSINSGANSIVIEQINPTVVNGSYSIYLYAVRRVAPFIRGDATAGSKQLTNCVYFPAAPAVGTYYDMKATGMLDPSGTFPVDGGLYVTGVSGGTVTFSNRFRSTERYTLNNGNAIHEASIDNEYVSANSPNYWFDNKFFLQGSRIHTHARRDYAKFWEVSRSGFMDFNEDTQLAVDRAVLKYIDPRAFAPGSGGTTDQVWAKNSNNDFDYGWRTLVGGAGSVNFDAITNVPNDHILARYAGTDGLSQALGLGSNLSIAAGLLQVVGIAGANTEASLNTTDAVEQTLATLAVANGFHALFDITVQVENNANNEIASVRFGASCKRVGADYTFIETPHEIKPLSAQPSLFGIVIDVRIHGAVPRIRVTGLAGNNLTFKATYSSITAPLTAL